MPSHPSDSTGSDWAARLYDERAAELILYGRALGLSHAEAEDVLHDAFRALLDLGQAPRQPHHYLVRAFRNRAFNHRRGLFRRLLRELQSACWFEQEPAPSSEEGVAVNALKELPAEQREVIVLKLWHGMTFEAIGTVVGVSPNTVAGRYRYGLEKLRTRLKEKPHEFIQRPGNNPAWLPPADTVSEG